MIKKRIYYTLLEVIVVIALLSMVGGIMAFKVRGFVAEQRFRDEVTNVVDHMRVAQELMMIMNADVYLWFESFPDRIEVSIRTDQKLAGNWNRILLKDPLKIKYARVIEFHGSDHAVKGKSNVIELRFRSGGSVMSYGVLRLATGQYWREGVFEKFISLKGYPHPIVTENTCDNFALTPKEAPVEPDEEALTKATYDAILQKQQE